MLLWRHKTYSLWAHRNKGGSFSVCVECLQCAQAIEDQFPYGMIYFLRFLQFVSYKTTQWRLKSLFSMWILNFLDSSFLFQFFFTYLQIFKNFKYLILFLANNDRYRDCLECFQWTELIEEHFFYKTRFVQVFYIVYFLNIKTLTLISFFTSLIFDFYDLIEFFSRSSAILL